MIRQPILIHASIVQQHVTRRNHLLRVIRVQAGHPPSMWLPLPCKHAIHVVRDATVVRLDLFWLNPSSGRQGVPTAKPNKHPRTRSIRYR